MEVRENGKFRQIFGPIPNVPNYLERFYGTQVLSIRIESWYGYRLTLKPIFHRKLGSRWVQTQMKSTQKKRNLHGQRQHFALGPNASYIPLTGVGGWRRR